MLLLAIHGVGTRQLVRSGHVMQPQRIVAGKVGAQREVHILHCGGVVPATNLG